MGFLDWIGFGSGGGGGPSSAVSEISRALDAVGEKNPKVARYLASFSFLLSRVAHADGDISTEEIELMRAIVRSRSGLTDEHATLAVNLAKDQKLALGTADDKAVAEVFKSVSTDLEKTELIDCLFSVASADQIIYPSEMKAISLIARQVGLSKKDVDLIAGGYEQYLQT